MKCQMLVICTYNYFIIILLYNYILKCFICF